MKNISDMRKRMNMKALSMMVIFGSSLFMASSCNKNDQEDPPELPPIESLQMDFSAFSSEPAGAKGTEATYNNFLYSYVQVGIWSIAATLYSAIPVAAYSHALQQTPVNLGDHSWEWSYNFTLNNLQYSATLTGERLDNEEFSMEMVIGLAASPASGVKWFDGVVRYDHTHAMWTFYEQGSVPVLEIEWNKDFVTEAGDLTYTIVKEGHAEEGSYISYTYTPGTDFDASFDISGAAGMADIEWNTATIKGRVMSLANFEDEDWHCWDSQANGLMDINCD
jgi:hypothetical protein